MENVFTDKSCENPLHIATSKAYTVGILLRRIIFFVLLIKRVSNLVSFPSDKHVEKICQRVFFEFVLQNIVGV